MMRWQSLALALCLAVLSPAAAPAVTAKSKKKPATSSRSKPKSKKKRSARRAPVRKTKVYVAPVSAKVRAAAMAQVSSRIESNDTVLVNAGALVPFFERVFSRKDDTPIHILHYGDSHTASDDWADSIRQRLQAKFGIGGPGFTMAGRPFRGYRRYDAVGNESSGWKTEGTVGHEGAGINGLSGVSIYTDRAGESITLTAQCEQIELYYLRQPGGGSFEFSVDGRAVERVSTDGEFTPGYVQFAAGPGQHRFDVRTLERAPVKLFGWAAENHSGLTYETLGINGASASMMLNWNQAIWTDQLARRNPALIIIAYGTNEAISPRWDSETYRAAFRQVVERLRTASPQASILIVGPPDCAYRSRRQRIIYPHLDEVVAVQRAVAVETGCAFWDWRARMGGPGSVRQWVAAGYSQADYVHFTVAGYRALGAVMVEELMDQYNRFAAVRAE